MPGMPQPNVNSRIIMAPEHAKRLLRALEDNVEQSTKEVSERLIYANRTTQCSSHGIGGEAMVRSVRVARWYGWSFELLIISICCGREI